MGLPLVSDMTMILWDYGRLEDPFVQRYAHHTEFALGVDFNIFVEGQVATCAWDERTSSLPSPPLRSA